MRVRVCASHGQAPHEHERGCTSIFSRLRSTTAKLEGSWSGYCCHFAGIGSSSPLICPNLTDFGPNSACFPRLGQTRPDSAWRRPNPGQIRPTSANCETAKFGYMFWPASYRLRRIVGQVRPADVDRCWRESTEFALMLAGICPKSAKRGPESSIVRQISGPNSINTATFDGQSWACSGGSFQEDRGLALRSATTAYNGRFLHRCGLSNPGAGSTNTSKVWTKLRLRLTNLTLHYGLRSINLRPADQL